MNNSMDTSPLVAVLSIEYDELNPDTYDGATLSIGGNGVWINTGVPNMDLLACAIIAEELQAYVVCSSSVDHFEMDGGDLDKYYGERND